MFPTVVAELIYAVEKLFDRKYVSLIINFKIKIIFLWTHDFLKTFYLKHILLMIIHTTIDHVHPSADCNLSCYCSKNYICS